MIVKFEVEMTEEEFVRMIGGKQKNISCRRTSRQKRGPNKCMMNIDDRVVSEAGDGFTHGVLFNKVKSGSFDMDEFCKTLDRLVDEGRIDKSPTGKTYAGKQVFIYSSSGLDN